MTEKLKILLVDDHAIVRNGIRMLLEQEEDIEVVEEASDGAESIEKYKLSQPDVVVMDIQMPVMNGIEATEALMRLNPDARILILSMHDEEEYILHAIDKGAMGYILKDAGNEELIRAIHTVYKGGKYFSGDVSDVLVRKYLDRQTGGIQDAPKASAPQEENPFGLTKREKEILGYVMEGLSSKEIAESLGKSVRTIEAHRFNIMKKLKVKSVVELVNKMSQYTS